MKDKHRAAATKDRQRQRQHRADRPDRGGPARPERQGLSAQVLIGALTRPASRRGRALLFGDRQGSPCMACRATCPIDFRHPIELPRNQPQQGRHGRSAASQDEHELRLRRAARARPRRGAYRRQQSQPLHLQGHQHLPCGHPHLALIDPGPEDPAHLAAILAAMGPRRISHVSSPTPTATTPTACPRCWPPPAPRPQASGAGPRRGTKRTSPSGGEFVDQDFLPTFP